MNDLSYNIDESDYLNYKVIYVPLNSNLMYPIYIPVVVNDEDVLKSSGKLSKKDYYDTINLNKNCGFPIAPILAALAPIVIPAAVKGAKFLINKIKSSGESEGRLNLGHGDELGGYIPTNPNIKTLKQLQALYDKYD